MAATSTAAGVPATMAVAVSVVVAVAVVAGMRFAAVDIRGIDVPGIRAPGADGAISGAAGGALAASVTADPAGPMRALPSLEGFIGRSFFEDPWIPAPATTTLRDGLGPLYNAHACTSCHRPAGRASADARAGLDADGGHADARGDAVRARPVAPPTGMVLRVGRRVGDSFTADPVYGDTIQRRSVPGVAAAAGEAAWGVGHVVEVVDDGLGAPRRLSRPQARITGFAYGDPAPGLLSSLRIAPMLDGVGRIERIADAVLLALEDPEDRDGDGISGRAHRLPATGAWPDAGPRIGRFGHKAAHPSLADQVGAALRDDIGITSRRFPAESCTAAQADCGGAPSGAGPDGPHEISDTLFDALVAHVASLAPPPRQRAAGAVAIEGADAAGRDEGGRLFGRAGCAACHVPVLPGSDGEPVVLHSDLLLHDMGAGLADALGEGDAGGAEWRTAPLVGIAGRERIGLLHDGRARSLSEAILWHGGEAASARERFRALGQRERGALLDYLRGL